MARKNMDILVGNILGDATIQPQEKNDKGCAEKGGHGNPHFKIRLSPQQGWGEPKPGQYVSPEQGGKRAKGP